MLPILIFDGMDKAGKTTLMYEIARRTNYKYVCIDRGSVGFKSYNDLLNKDHSRSDYDIMELQLRNVSHLMIYCRPNNSIITKRLKEAGETLPGGTNIIETLYTFDRYYEHSVLNKMSLDTGMSIQKCVELIMLRLEFDEVKKVDLKLKQAMRVREPGAKIVRYHPIQLSLTDEDFRGVAFDPRVDLPYYQMLESNLSHIVHKRDIGMINDRQMIYTSPDCISMIQLDVDSGEYGELIVHVHQRSLNMAKHAHTDICVVYEIVKKIFGKKVKINYSIAFPHHIS